MGAEYILEMRNIFKSYAENQVLKDVTIKVRPGEIHALMGENGAGKSTLMNILFGMPVIHGTGGYEGEILMEGEPVHLLSPDDSMAAGIGMVHQEFMLIPGFTITENIKLGRELTKPNMISRFLGKSLEMLDRKGMEKDAGKALETIGLTIDQHVRVKGLPVGYMQFIEIAREIDKKGIKLLVFDEPTAVLTESEAERLLEAMRVIASKGIAIIFITHRLDEVMAVADTMTVLRDGKLITTKPIAETSTTEIAELMIGHKVERLIDQQEDDRQLSFDNIALSIKDLYVDMPGERVMGIDLEVRKGEIFGIGGLAGQGKLGVANGIMGMYPAEGTVEVFGEPVEMEKLGSALHHGVAFVSEDRREVGLLLDESIQHNISFRSMVINNDYIRKLGFIKFMNLTEIADHARDMIQLLDIRCTGPAQKVGSLSGGNQQKICLASALTLKPEVLFVSEPTRGIDIGAKQLVIDYLSKLSLEEGITIVIISSELAELRSICDRIALISEGQITAILEPDAPEVDFGLAMSGKKVEGGRARG